MRRSKPARCNMVQVLNSQGLANQSGSESCVGASNRSDEALIGERTGRVLSRENGTLNFRAPTDSWLSEGYTVLVVIARWAEALRGRRPRTCTETSCAGTGRAWVCPFSGTHREVSGRNPMMSEPRQSDGCVVPGKSSNKPGMTTGAEGMEGRRPTKWKVLQSPMPRTQSRMMGMYAVLECLR